MTENPRRPANHPWRGWKENDFGRAVSRILSTLSRAERIICLSSQYPGPIPPCGTWSGRLRGPLFGLAPDGVFRASALALGAVGSYPTFSPLPAPLAKRGRYILCGTFRRHASRHGLPRVSRSRPSCVGPAGYAASRPMVFGLSSSPGSLREKRSSALPKSGITYLAVGALTSRHSARATRAFGIRISLPHAGSSAVSAGTTEG